MNRNRLLLTRLHACLLAVAVATAALAQNEPTPAGTWEGFLELPGAMLGVSVTLTQDAAGWSGSIDIPAQGFYGLPLEGVAVWGADVTFGITGVAGEPTFTGTLTGDTIRGAFSQFGQQYPFSLARSDGTNLATQTLFEDSTGRYTVRIPAGWTAFEQDGVATVMSPEGGVLVHFMVGPVADWLDGAVADAWDLVDGGPGLDPIQVLEPPSSPGVDHTLLYNYGSASSAFLYQALVQVVGDELYLMLVEGSMDEAQRVGAQLQIVVTSFTIAAVD